MLLTLKFLAEHDAALKKEIPDLRITYSFDRDWVGPLDQILIRYEKPGHRAVEIPFILNDPNASWFVERKRIKLPQWFKTPTTSKAT